MIFLRPIEIELACEFLAASGDLHGRFFSRARASSRFHTAKTLSGSSSRARFKMPLSRGFDSSTRTAGPRTYAGIPSMRLNPVAPGSNKVRFNLKLAAAKSA